ncbi:hydrogen peroxide-inducible genes activator [Thermaurantiacus sp.]
MIYLPTIKQLQYLVALHRTGHFGRAADACHVSQSTLSAGIQELETLLDCVLVERTRRVVRFTPLGNQVVERAWRLLAEAEAIAELARASGRPLAGELRLGVIPTIAPFLLPRLLPGLRAAWPELRLYLREEQSDQACALLARGELDCVLLALPWACGDVEAEVLFEDPILLAFHPADLPAPAAKVDPATLPQERLLLLEDGHCLKDHALAACGRAGLRADAAVLGTSLHTLVQMVENRIGCTFLPRLAVDSGILAGTQVETRPLDSPRASRQIALIWRPTSPRSAEFRLLAAELRKAAAALLRPAEQACRSAPGSAPAAASPRG